MFKWFRRHREAARRAPADADALVRKYGDDALCMARRLEESALLAVLADMAPIHGRTPEQWRRVAHLIEQSTHHRQSLDAMARMAATLSKVRSPEHANACGKDRKTHNEAKAD